MSAFVFSIEGADELFKKLNNLPKALQERVDADIKDTVLNIESKAVVAAAASANTGTLRLGIGKEKEKVMQWTVFASKGYSAYVEFGTGELVNVPAGLESYAIQFKGKGVREVNLPARPFLFPAYFEERKKLIDMLKKVLIK